MSIAANVIVGWPSTAASIPSGWTRETTLDSVYVVGAATGADADLVTTRGNTSHTHTSPAHAPTQASHGHTVANTTADASPTNATTTGTSLTRFADSGHIHSTPVNVPSATAVNDSLAISVDATANDLSHVSVIWIKSDGSPSTIPVGAIAFFESDSLPASWSRIYGDYYLKGASPGGNGGAVAGSNTHTHTSPAHTHTQQPHTHDGVYSDLPDSVQRKNTTTGTSFAGQLHTHGLTFDDVVAVNNAVVTTLSDVNHEPPYKKLNVITPSVAGLPVSVIALWGGTAATIPSGWARYTAMDGLWHKSANTNGESGVATGGSTTHTHTASDCQPTQLSHTHTATDNGHGGTAASAANAGAATGALYGHTHSHWDVSTDTATNLPASVTIDTSAAGDAYPLYRTVIFIYWSGTPARTPSCFTSYDFPQFESIEGKVLPEVAQRIARGDRRFFPEAP